MPRLSLMSASPVRTAAAAAVALLALTACTTGGDPDAAATSASAVTSSPPKPADGETVPDLTAESCREILTEVAGLNQAMSESLANIAAAPEAFGRVADNIRAAGQDAGDDVSAAAENLAVAIDHAVEMIRDGDVFGVDDALTPAITQMFDVCR
jgi:hypothetical protein